MKIELYRPHSIFAQGNRDHMEDYIFPLHGTASDNDRLFIVCDGMGGHTKGEVASKLACEEFASYFRNNKPEELSEKYFLSAFDHVQDEFDKYISSHTEAKGMGTTIVLVYLAEDAATVVHCGDSRFYHLRKDKILFRTRDHKLVEEMVRQGIISAEAAKNHPKKNVITRAIQGKLVSNPKPEIHFLRDLKPGDYMLLCTDGISDGLSDQQISEILSSDTSDEEKMNLIQAMCEGNSNDNYSAYLIKIKNISS